MYIYSPLTKRLFPDFKDASKAVQSAARSGDARDTRPLMACLMRVAEASPRVVGNLETRRTALEAFDWALDPDPGIQPDDPKLLAARERIRSAADEAISYHTDTPAYGIFCAQLAWTFDPEIAAQRPSITHRFAPVEIERGEGRTINQVSQEGTLVRTPINIEGSGEYLWDIDSKYARGGLLATILFLQIMADKGWQQWTKYSERLKGMVLGKLEEWAGDDDKAAVVETLKNMLISDFAVGSKAASYELMTPVNYLGATSYKDFIAAIQEATSVVILGQSGTTQLPANGGSRAALQVLQLVRADILYSDMIRMERMLQNQLVDADAQINLGLMRAPWRFRFSIEQEQNRESNARIITDYLNAGIPVRKADVYGSVGLIAPSETDEVIVKSATTIPPI